VCAQIHTDLANHGNLDVGLVSGSSRRMTARVQVCTIGMIDRAYDRVWDIMLLDEKHECATLKRIAALMQVKCRAAYGLSANDGDKQDTSELWLNAIFGPVRSNVTYREVVQENEVVPVRIHWIRTPVEQYRPGRLRPGSVHMDRYALWRNVDRNAEAVRLALKSVAERGQTMIYVSTIEHALQLRSMVDCPVAIRPQSTEDWNVWEKSGEVPPGMLRPSSNMLGELEDSFKDGKVRLVIANSVWKRGLNFPHLKTLIRLDGSATMEDATQITGRVNRPCPGKVDGLVYDFWDVQEPSLLDRSRNRKKAYRDIGYTQEGDTRTVV
jgi:superfamily II DNA or RNA helicase